MKNIIEILKSLGIDVPEDKETALTKEVAENYKTVAEYEKKMNRFEADLEKEKERANTAEEALKGFEGKDFEGMQKEVESWKAKAEQAKADYEAKELARSKTDAINEAVKDIKFSSNSAKRAFIADLEKEDLHIKDGALLGFNDYLKGYMETDATAFVNEAEENKVMFTEPQNQQTPNTDTNLADLRKAMGLE